MSCGHCRPVITPQGGYWSSTVDLRHLLGSRVGWAAACACSGVAIRHVTGARCEPCPPGRQHHPCPPPPGPPSRHGERERLVRGGWPTTCPNAQRDRRTRVSIPCPLERSGSRDRSGAASPVVDAPV